MALICPTILANTPEEFNTQIKRVIPFARRIQIDLADGQFTESKTIGLDKVWWPHGVQCDLHLMYKKPMEFLNEVIHLKPSLVIIHAEADVHHMHFAAELHKEGILAGLAILPDTPIVNTEQIMHSFDHVLIFGGHLGHFGGQADLSLLRKAQEAKSHHKSLEIGWDGGINDQNAKEIAEAGVDVLNVGGFIQNSADPASAFAQLSQQIT